MSSPDLQPSDKVYTNGKNWKAEPRRWISRPAHDAKGIKRARTLVICFDGTGDSFDDDNSNIVKLTSLLKKDDPTKQMVYYQSGIGTSSSADARFSFVRNTTQILDSMFAITLGTHVLGGYEFLMNHYHEGDSICIFGFSRGAYTARALAGMIQKVGLLPTGNEQQLPFAYQIFSNESKADFAQQFKDTFSINVKIQFVGVWDTVASVGLIPRYLPFVSNNTDIRCFRHALALDEHRAKFVPNFYHYEEQESRPFEAAGFDTTSNGGLSNSISRTASSSSDSTAAGSEDSPNTKIETSVKEVWFAGVHTDVGGGSVRNKTRHSLARISLRWMIRECWRENTGIIFDMKKLRDVAGLDLDWDNGEIKEPPMPLPASAKDFVLEGRISPVEPNYLQKAWEAISSPVANIARAFTNGFRGILGYKPLDASDPEPLQSYYKHDPDEMPFESEAVEELFDALSPMYDQLHLNPHWWLLEWLPFWDAKDKAIDANTSDLLSPPTGSLWDWLKALLTYLKGHHFTVNKGRGRKIYKHIMNHGMLVHRSVLTRLDAIDRNGKSGTYVPLVRPKIPGYTSDNDEVRTMTQQEWTNALPENSNLPWFFPWGFSKSIEAATKDYMAKILDAQEARSSKAHARG